MAEPTQRGRTWEGVPHASPTAGAWPPWLGGTEALPGSCVGASGPPRADHPVSMGTRESPWVPVREAWGEPKQERPKDCCPSCILRPSSLRPPWSAEGTSCRFQHSIPLRVPLCSPARPGLPRLGYRSALLSPHHHRAPQRQCRLLAQLWAPLPTAVKAAGLYEQALHRCTRAVVCSSWPGWCPGSGHLGAGAGAASTESEADCPQGSPGGKRGRCGATR